MNKQDIIIDYIIPCSYSEDIICRGLDVLCKQTCKDNLNVILVNDCSANTDDNYKSIVDKYKNTIKLRVVKTEHIVGPGMAMQIGIDAGTNDYILIQDDDDYLCDEYVIEKYIDTIMDNAEYNNIASISANVIAYNRRENKKYSVSAADGTLKVHGRLFYRDILSKFNIRYNDDVSWWVDDSYLYGLLMYISNKYGYRNIYLDYESYIYNVAECNESVTMKMGKYEIKFIDYILKAEQLMYYRNNNIEVDNEFVYTANSNIFIGMVDSILRHLGGEKYPTKREWDILKKCRIFIINNYNMCSVDYSPISNEYNANDLCRLSKMYLEDEESIFDADYDCIKNILKIQ